MWLRPSVLALFLFVLGLPHHSLAQEGQPAREAKVKVAFIYNFAKFANWPDRAFETLPHNSFSICLVGKEPLGNLLDQLAGSKTIKGRTILFRKIVFIMIRLGMNMFIVVGILTMCLSGADCCR